MTLSIKAKFYLFFFPLSLAPWALMNFFNTEFVNQAFFMTAYVWHLALMTPGMRELVLLKNQRFSFLGTIVRVNHYLQLFISFKSFSYTTGLIRSLSPMMFTFFLLVLGGSGNLLYTLAGSLFFELGYILFQKKFSPLVNIDVQEIQKEIQP